MLQSEPGYFLFMRPEDVIAFSRHPEIIPSLGRFPNSFCRYWNGEPKRRVRLPAPAHREAPEIEGERLAISLSAYGLVGEPVVKPHVTAWAGTAPDNHPRGRSRSPFDLSAPRERQLWSSRSKHCGGSYFAPVPTGFPSNLTHPDDEFSTGHAAVGPSLGVGALVREIVFQTPVRTL